MRKAIWVVLGVLACTAHADAAQDPETVFKNTCGNCHNGQLPAAPAKGDSKAWAARLQEKGMDQLISHVTNGYNAMPPRGLCGDCTAEDYRAVIEWMSK